MLPKLVMFVFVAASSALFGQTATAGARATPDVLTIIRRSVDRDAQNFARYRDYTYEETTVQNRYDKNGKVSGKPESQTDEVLILAGEPYSRLIARDGKPIPEKEARKEQEKLDKELARRLKDPKKQQAKYEKDRAEERRFLREIPEAFNFTLLGEETLSGLPVWKIRAEPKPGYKPRESRAGNLKKVRGTLWIDQTGYQWVKADVEVIDTISWGFFVLRIPPGASIQFQQTRVNQEVWMPISVKIRADARLGLLKTFRMGIEVSYANYRKFQASSELVGFEEIPSPK